MTLLSYQQLQRNAVKRQAMRWEIARLRAQVIQLKTQRAKLRDRFKTMQKLGDTLNAIRQALES